MRVAILGAGNGGYAMAAELSLAGHQVALVTRSEDKLRELTARGGVDVQGVLGDRFVPIAQITSSIAEAVAGARLIALPVPTMVQEAYLRDMLPHVGIDQAIWMCPGNGGSLVAHRMLDEVGKGDVLLIDSLTLPYSARRVGPTAVGVTARFKPPTAAFPARRTDEALSLMRDCLDLPPALNVLEALLTNVNPVIHPLPSLLNWGWIENRDGMFSLYGEGMSPGVLTCLRALDEERVAVCAAAGVSTLAVDDIYAALGLRALYRESMGLGKAEKYEDRFVVEDVPFGLVAFATLGAQLGVPTPTIDATIDLSTVVYRKDFWSTGRTAEHMGLGGMGPAEMREFLWQGRAA